MEDYYIVVDEVEENVHICNYLFNDSNPRGIERKVFTRGYGKDSAFTLEEAESFCSHLCDIFNSKRFRRESISYGKARS